MISLCIVLHAHLPYVRDPAHPRSLEERWLHEALVESYLPLLGMLDGLARDRVGVKFTMSVTPTLCAMLRDSMLQTRFLAHVSRVRTLAQSELRRLPLNAPTREALEAHLAFVASVETVFRAHGGDVLGGFVDHVKAGRLELLASAATHAYLPGLLARPEALRAQICAGLSLFRKATGLQARGFWLPECAFDPAIDSVLAELGVSFSFVSADGLRLAEPRPPLDTSAPIVSPNGVVYFGRDEASANQVWSREAGYPGHGDHREFHRDVGFDLAEDDLLGEIGPDAMRLATGIKLHRVTGRDVPLELKEPYLPERAAQRATSQAEHFLEARIRQGSTTEAMTGHSPLIVCPYDAELFGHWWFEGPKFLDSLFRLGAQNDDLRFTTPSEHLSQRPRLTQSMPQRSSWGHQGQSEVWMQPSNAWIWPLVHRCMAKLETEQVKRLPRQRRALLAAEAHLMAASDWPFMIAMGTTTRYAERRVAEHGQAFAELLATEGSPEPKDDFRRVLGEAIIGAGTDEL